MVMQRRIRLDCSGRTSRELLRRLEDEVGAPASLHRVVLHVDNASRVSGSLSGLLQDIISFFHARSLKASIVDPSGCTEALYRALGGSVHVEVCRSESEISRPLEILVVEDTPDSLDFLSAFLEAAGHRVSPARSAHEALALCASRRFDLVLLDLVLPDMDGLSVARELRESGVPIVAMSAYLDRWEDSDYCAAGFRGRIRKPFKTLELLAALKN
jgi:CheY-like chemotaxis protein